jgi:hypothetical protein
MTLTLEQFGMRSVGEVDGVHTVELIDGPPGIAGPVVLTDDPEHMQEQAASVRDVIAMVNGMDAA